jgi:hypothetical protein
VFFRLALATFLLGHAAIHAAFLAPRPPATAGGPPWPFELERSWIMARQRFDPAVTRLIGLALVALTIGGFAMAALSVLGVAPPGLWASAAIGAVGSIGLLILFFHPWLVLGLAIDLALLWAVLIVGWAPDGGTP